MDFRPLHDRVLVRRLDSEEPQSSIQLAVHDNPSQEYMNYLYLTFLAPHDSWGRCFFSV